MFMKLSACFQIGYWLLCKLTTDIIITATAAFLSTNWDELHFPGYREVFGQRWLLLHVQEYVNKRSIDCFEQNRRLLTK